MTRVIIVLVQLVIAGVLLSWCLEWAGRQP